jgi:hypothetical protein
VPRRLRRHYLEHLWRNVVSEGGCLIACSYGSSRPEGNRTELLVDDFEAWHFSIAGVYDVVSEEHGFVIVRAVALRK